MRLKKPRRGIVSFVSSLCVFTFSSSDYYHAQLRGLHRSASMPFIGVAGKRDARETPVNGSFEATRVTPRSFFLFLLAIWCLLKTRDAGLQLPLARGISHQVSPVCRAVLRAPRQFSEAVPQRVRRVSFGVLCRRRLSHVNRALPASQSGLPSVSTSTFSRYSGGLNSLRRVEFAYRFRCGGPQNRLVWSATPQRRSQKPRVSSPHRRRR